MFLLNDGQIRPCRMIRRHASEFGRRMQLEHFAHVGKFEREFAGEALQDPMAVRPLLDQAETAEANEEFAHHRCSCTDLARQFQLVDLHAWLRFVGENAQHETALDDVVQRIGLFLRKQVRLGRLAQHGLLPLVPANDAGITEAHQNGARRAAANAEFGGDLGLGRQGGIRLQAGDVAVIRLLEERVLSRHFPLAYHSLLSIGGDLSSLLG